MHRGIFGLLIGFFIILMTLLHSSQAIPFYPNGYPNSRHKDYLVEIDDPDAVLEMFARLGQSIYRAQHEGSNAKRGLDLGLGRGFSGSQAAKHLMGLAAANFAAGPGKKKRADGIELNGVGRGELLTFRVPPSSFSQDLLTSAGNSNENEWINPGTAKE